MAKVKVCARRGRARQTKSSQTESDGPTKPNSELFSIKSQLVTVLLWSIIQSLPSSLTSRNILFPPVKPNSHHLRFSLKPAQRRLLFFSPGTRGRSSFTRYKIKTDSRRFLLFCPRGLTGFRENCPFRAATASQFCRSGRFAIRICCKVWCQLCSCLIEIVVCNVSIRVWFLVVTD